MTSNLPHYSDFELWARTGRRRTEDGLGPIEVKFNPWHDIRTGEFTFRNAGRLFGLGSGKASTFATPALPKAGGNKFGGGGASGSWRRHIPPRPPAADHAPPAQPQHVSKDARSAPDLAAKPSTSAQYVTITKNGYTFKIDADHRTREVAGKLHFAAQPSRSRTAQANAGGADRRPKDDGGHYIAARFNGPTDAFNHFAQARGFNRGGYRALENHWAKVMKQGGQVKVHITPHYSGKSFRPDSLRVEYLINGKFEFQSFSNSNLEKPHDR